MEFCHRIFWKLTFCASSKTNWKKSFEGYLIYKISSLAQEIPEPQIEAGGIFLRKCHCLCALFLVFARLALFGNILGYIECLISSGMTFVMRFVYFFTVCNLMNQ